MLVGTVGVGSGSRKNVGNVLGGRVQFSVASSIFLPLYYRAIATLLFVARFFLKFQ